MMQHHVDGEMMDEEDHEGEENEDDMIEIDEDQLQHLLMQHQQ